MTKKSDPVAASQQEAQAAKDEEEAKGFFGVEVDPTPNEHYTVDGVTSGKPTPETDADTHHAAHAAALGSRFPKKEGESK
jgi:hypothetical protein